MKFYSFETEDAVQYGVNEAIIIQVLRFWILKNKANNRHHHDGRTWTYNSIEAFTKIFPFWTGKQILHVIQKLTNANVLIKGNFNSTPYDRTLWYAFSDETILDDSILPKTKIDLPNLANDFDEKGKSTSLLNPLLNQPTTPPSPPKGKKKVFPDELIRLWKSYPSAGRERSGLDKALKEWVNLTKEEQDSCPASLAAWKESRKWTEKDGQFIDGVDKWLRNGMWRETPEASIQHTPGKIQEFEGWTQPEY